jgi:hypothetical protein
VRFFSANWFASDDEAVDDDMAADRVLQAYKCFLDGLQGPVGKKIRDFSNAHSLHDGLLDRLAMVDSSVQLGLIIGDLQVGYSHLCLRYRDARLLVRSTDEMREALDSEHTEVLYDEFDVLDATVPHTYVHRFLLWPDERSEFGIAFRDFEVTVSPLEGRERVSRGERFTQR